jgi:hypothetical protein
MVARWPTSPSTSSLDWALSALIPAYGSLMVFVRTEYRPDPLRKMVSKMSPLPEPPIDKGITGIKTHVGPISPPAGPTVPPNTVATTSSSALNQAAAANAAQNESNITPMSVLQEQVAELQTQVAALQKHVHSFQLLDPPGWGTNNIAALKDWILEGQGGPFATSAQGGGDFSNATFPCNLNLAGSVPQSAARVVTAYTSSPTSEPPPSPPPS